MARTATHGSCYYCGQPTVNGECDDCGAVPMDLQRFGAQLGVPTGCRAMTDAEVASAEAYHAAKRAENPDYDPNAYDTDW